MARTRSPSAFVCLVTGGSGFVGRYIIRTLTERFPDWTIVSLDLQLPPPKDVVESGKCQKENDQIVFAVADVADPASIGSAIHDANPDIVIHTAGIVPPMVERWGRRWEEKVMSVNVRGTRNVVEAITGKWKEGAGADGGAQKGRKEDEKGGSVTKGTEKALRTRALVYTSSCCAVIDDLKFEYRNVDERWPTAASGSSIYGESKAQAEHIVLAANNPPTLSTCILRPSVLTGPGDVQLIPAIHACIAKHETPYILGPGLNLWDVTDVRNVAHAHVLAAANLLSLPPFASPLSQPNGQISTATKRMSPSAAGEIFFIQNNQPLPFRDFCRAVWREFGHVPPFEVHIPLWAARVAGAACEAVGHLVWGRGAMVTYSRGSVMDACATRYASGEKARQVLGFEAEVGLEECVRESCADLKRRLATTTHEQKQQQHQHQPEAEQIQHPNGNVYLR